MPLSHPTILIGYDAYGRTVLRKLLANASSRGLLAWEDAVGTTGPSARRLKDLALIGVAPEVTGESALAGDLYRQIQNVWPPERNPHAAEPHLFLRTALKEAVVQAKKRLLDAASRANDPSRLRLGLDVVVLAQVSGIDILGALEDLLEPALEALANDPTLRSPAPGQDLLNFILFLDFEHYWDKSPQGGILRKEASAFVRRWQDRHADARPSFGRIYVSDAYAGDGHRTIQYRIDETTLFLEFALFEGQRDEENLQRLYQKGHDQHILAAFGIRAIERSRGLLRRLAAARFACAWLEYLAGDHAAGGVAGRRQFSRRLDPYRPEALDRATPAGQLEGMLAKGLETIEKDLMDVPFGPRWPEQITQQAFRSRLYLRNDLANWAGQEMQQISEGILAGFPKNLEDLVTSALHDPSAPVPLGAVIEEVRKLQADLQILAPPPESPSVQSNNILTGIRDLHRRYDRFVTGQINVDEHRDWWPMLGFALAAIWAPLVIEALEELVPRNGGSWYSEAATLAVLWLGKPAIMTTLLIAGVWITGQTLVQPWLAKRVERGRSAFTHRERGVLVDRIRETVKSGPFVDSMRAYASEVSYEMKLRLRKEVGREVARVADLLSERQREIEWLRYSLLDFQRSNGMDPSGPPNFEMDRDRQASCRYAMECTRDLQRILAANPATPQRFESSQASLSPFQGWTEPYCDVFLYPLDFLEKFSREYEEQPSEHLVTAEEEREMRAKEIGDFLEQFGQFSPGMEWDSAEGHAAAETIAYCVMPEIWKGLPNVMARLGENGFTEKRVLVSQDAERAYLLRIQLGLDPARILNQEPA
jgi:hypothetical protein